MSAAQHPVQLPNDLAGAHALIRTLFEQVSRSDRELEQLRQRIDQLCRRLFGRSSERVDPNQLALAFAEATATAQQEEALPEKPPTPANARTGKGHGRRARLEDLPRQVFINDIAELEKCCGTCNVPLQKIGEDSRERLDYVPASVLILETVTPKYSCPKCHDGVRRAASLPEPIEKGIAGPGLLAYVAVSKFADHLPLNRLEGILGRHGVQLSRKTMCDWLRDVANAVEPIWDALKVEILQARVIQSDDTPVSVLEKGRGPSIGRFWVYRDPLSGRAVYQFTKTRSREGPVGFLSGYRGYLQADAYSGYDEIFRGSAVIEAACWAHARRKFVESLDSDRVKASLFVALIRQLYDVEREANAFSSDERRVLRQSRALPVISELGRLSQELLPGVLPKTPLGVALGYMRNQWTALSTYLSDGDIPIDNNGAERALRRVAVGRNNWLFAGSPDGGRRAAILMTLIENCRDAGVEPQAYLRDVLMRVATHPASRVAELTPHRWKPLLEAPGVVA